MSTALERGEHGVTAWRRGCRCPSCRAGLRRSAKVWWATRVLRRGGDPATHVPAAPVRRRLAELGDYGYSLREVAALADVAPSTLSRIAKPSTRRCSRIVARAVLAVAP